MKLEKWLALAEITPAQFAREIGCTADMIYKVLHRRKRFGLDQIAKIQIVTQGWVGFDDLYLPREELRK